MKKRWLKKLVKVAVIATAACAIGGFAVTHGGVAAGYAVATASLAVALAVVFSGRRAVRAGDAIVDAPPAHPVTESVT